MSIVIHPLTETGLEASDAALQAAYQDECSRQDTQRRYLASQPSGSLVVSHNDTIVGFAGVLDYGPFAYIGLMAARPQVPKRGIGRLLLERFLAWLEVGGCPTVLLDSRSAGTPRYEQCEFMDDDSTWMLHQQEDKWVSCSLPENTALLSEYDLPVLVAFDTLCFGAERKALLTSNWTDAPHRVLVFSDASG